MDYSKNHHYYHYYWEGPSINKILIKGKKKSHKDSSQIFVTNICQKKLSQTSQMSQKLVTNVTKFCLKNSLKKLSQMSPEFITNVTKFITKNCHKNSSQKFMISIKSSLPDSNLRLTSEQIRPLPIHIWHFQLLSIL